MLSIHSPLQTLLLAANDFTPINLYVRVVFSLEKPNGKLVEVTQDEDPHTRVVVLWSERTLSQLVETMLEGLAVAISGDADRGASYAQIRDEIRQSYDALREVN